MFRQVATRASAAAVFISNEARFGKDSLLIEHAMFNLIYEFFESA